MSIVQDLCTLALGQLVPDLVGSVGIDLKIGGHNLVGKVLEAVNDRLTDQSERLQKALGQASNNAWRAFEVALAGSSWWERVKAKLARGEDKAFAEQVRAFLAAAALPAQANQEAFRQQCLKELQAARQAGVLAGVLEWRTLGPRVAEFAKFSDPLNLLNAEWALVQGMADQLRQDYPRLAWFLAQRPPQGLPLLVAAVRYFFRREIEKDRELYQGLSWVKLERLGEVQDRQFAALADALQQHGERLEQLLGDLEGQVAQTHGKVLDIEALLLDRLEPRLQQLGQQMADLLQQYQLQRREELRATDSLSIRGDQHRDQVRQLAADVYALPEADRRHHPALLHALGKLEVVAGDYVEAQRDFQQVATLVAEPRLQALAHFNAYRAALERAGDTQAEADWHNALQELLRAVQLDAASFEPFPMAKYQPRRILGAGGFGVVFLCQHREMADLVVVKALTQEADGDVDATFAEARALRQIEHPGIIRTLDAGYMDATNKRRPYIVMDYFPGDSLEGFVRQHGPVPVEDLVTIAAQVAEGLRAAHGRGIWHRDIKPANLLVRRDDHAWRVKIIDFGLALFKQSQQATGKTSTSQASKTLRGQSIAGTLNYAAPEQMGQLPGVPVGPHSDVYGFGKTCAFALFQTTQPRSRHFQKLPKGLTDLLEACLEEPLEQRLANFDRVLQELAKVKAQLCPVVELVAAPPPLPTKEAPAEAIPAVIPVLAEWYLLRDGKQTGPFSEDTLRAMMGAGRIRSGDLVWKQGLTAWKPVGSVFAEKKSVKRARVHLSIPGPGLLASAFNLSRLSDPWFKLYVNGKFTAEWPIRKSQEVDVQLPVGSHTLDIAVWDNQKEKEKRQFALELPRAGVYDLRFNFPGKLAESSLEVLQEPA